jgi:hypothetical protein
MREYLENGEVKQIIGDRANVGKSRLIKNSEGKIVTNEIEMMNAWTQYMEKVLNDGQVRTPAAITAEPVLGPEMIISQREENCTDEMKTGKADGPRGIGNDNRNA